MSTIKQDRKDLEMLLNGIAPVQPPSDGLARDTSAAAGQKQQYIDNTSGTSLIPEMTFEFDYDAIRKGIRKKCRKTVINMVRHILPPDLLEDEYIIDKEEQDIETLTELGMQTELNRLMQRALVDSVKRGNLAPRNFEVFGQLTDKLQAINKQTVDTEQKIRKTYLDLKFETMDKRAELNESATQKMLTGGQQTDNGVIYTSTKDLIAAAKKKHQEALAAAKETEYIEEDD